MKFFKGTINVIRFIMKTIETLLERIATAWYDKRYMAFALNIIYLVSFIGLIFGIIYALKEACIFIAALLGGGKDFLPIIVFALVILSPDIIDWFYKRKDFPPPPSLPPPDKEEAIRTYQRIIHPNMLIILKEVSKYFPIYEPTSSSIIPPDIYEGLIYKGSHWLFETCVKIQRTLTGGEIESFESAIQDIIKQKLTVHQLVNLDSEWVQDGQGASYPKIMVDSVLVTQDTLQIFIALASESYLNYKMANPRYAYGQNNINDDFLNRS